MAIPAEQPDPEIPSCELKYKGVRKRKCGDWVAEIKLLKPRKQILLGSFHTPEKAALAFDAALYYTRGCTANFNFPHPTFDSHTGIAPARPSIVKLRAFAASFANENPSPPSAAAGGEESSSQGGTAFHDSNRVTVQLDRGDTIRPKSDLAARMPSFDTKEAAAPFNDSNRATDTVLMNRGEMTRPESDPESNPTERTPAATPVSNTKAVSCSRFKTIFLHEWWLVKGKGNGLAVGGVASLEMVGERLFFSAVIARRHVANIIETEDGITIHLGGLINRPHTHQNGFPSEVCDRFMLGFPHNWKEYTANGLTEEHVNGEDGFWSFSEDTLDDTTLCLLLPKNIHDVVKSGGNCSKKSDLNNEMEPNITMKTTQCNGKNGVVDLTAEKQDKKSKIDCQTVTDKSAPKPGKGLSRSCADKSPSIAKKEKKDHLLSGRKEQHCIKQKMILEDARNSCKGIEKRSVSKGTHAAMLAGRGEASPVTSVSSSVRRSARLRNLKN